MTEGLPDRRRKTGVTVTAKENRLRADPREIRTITETYRH